MKVCTVMTGGTIASKCENGVRNVSGSSYGIIEEYRKNRSAGDIEFITCEPLNVLSENMSLGCWQTLIDTLNGLDFSEFDGIIITHGSDTLAYTSVLLSYIYEKTCVPILLVAANHPINDERSNGLANFDAAVKVIKAGVNGVFVPYKNAGENVTFVYDGRRVVSASPYNDNFSSFDGKYVGYVADGEFTFCGKNIYEGKTDYRAIKLQKSVLLLNAYPGLDYGAINLGCENLGAAVHYLYHSATGCVDGVDTSILNFISRCGEREIKSYIASLKHGDSQPIYDTTQKILKTGANVLYDVSPEQAYIKALLEVNM